MMIKQPISFHDKYWILWLLAAVIASVFFIPKTAGVLLEQTEDEKPAVQQAAAPPVFNPAAFGAVPNDAKDDTKSIQKAIDEAAAKKGVVRIPAGTFLINTNPDTGTLHVRDGSVIQLDSKTILKAIPNDLPIYRIFTVYNRTNIKISGGTLVGDRYDHTDTGGEFGHGIFIAGSSSNITVSGVTAKDFWGDGFIVEGDAKNRTYPTDVAIHNVTGDNNRRQGISITAGKNIIVKNSTFSNTNGTAPEAGIDLERDPPFDLPLEDVELLYNKVTGNNGYGIAFVYASYNSALNNVVTGNKAGGIYIGGSQDSGAADENTIRNNFISGNSENGIFINFSTKNAISGNTIEKSEKDGISMMNHIGQNRISTNLIRQNKGNGVSVWGGLNDQSGIVIQSNEVRGNGGAGLSVVDVTDATIIHNRLLSNTQAGMNLKAVKESTVQKNTAKGNGRNDE